MWSRRCLVIEIENLQKEKIVYIIPLMYNIKLGVHMYILKVMYIETFYFAFFSLMMENYENNLVFFLGHCRPETLISASLTYFHDSLWISPLFLCILSRSDRFNPNSCFTFKRSNKTVFFLFLICLTFCSKSPRLSETFLMRLSGSCVSRRPRTSRWSVEKELKKRMMKTSKR